MGKQIFLDGYVGINGIDLSDHVADVTLDLTAADVQVTAMGAKGIQRLSGLQDNKVTVTFWQDFAASEVDATLYPLFSSGSTFAATILATKTGGASTMNPAYSGTFIIVDYPPISGKVGDALSNSVTMVCVGTITRGTTGP